LFIFETEDQYIKNFLILAVTYSVVMIACCGENGEDKEERKIPNVGITTLQKSNQKLYNYCQGMY